MNNFRILNYLRKYLKWIALFSLCAGVLFVLYAFRAQTYTANTVIRYANNGAVEGKAPDGTKLDLSEISSAKVMTEVFEELSLEYKDDYFDDMRSRVKVEAIVPSQAAEIQQALNQQGETYSEEPTDYRVSFTAKSSEGKEFAQRVLNTLVEKYLVYYSENHVNSQIIANTTSDITSSGYDYIEIMELLEQGIANTKDALLRKFDSDNAFRSTTNGYSFYDLYCEFDYLDKVHVSDLFAKILDNQITRDKSVLVSKYTQRINDYDLNNLKDQTEVKKVLEIISSYVDMMKRSGNTEIDYNYILEDVYNTYNENNQGGEADRTVEYEVLLKNYVSKRESYEHDIIDAAYCQYIIDAFSDTKEDGAKYATADSVAKDIDALVERMNELYVLANQTNADYNEYLGAVNVVPLTSTDVAEGLNIKLYLIVAFVLFVLLGCIGAVLIGRVTELAEYYVNTDRQSGLANKTKCDEFMDDYRNKFLSANQACILVSALDDSGEGSAAAKFADDTWMNAMGNMLREAFQPEEQAFLGSMGGGLFVVFNKDTTEEKAEYYMDLLRSKVEAYNAENEKQIHYSYAISESGKEHVFSIRDLFQRTLEKL